MLLLVVVLLLGGFWLSYFLLPPAAGLPILMYHKVSDNQNDKLTISADRLDGQLACLRRLGYQSVSFSDLREHERFGVPLPEKPVILTFDDGYLNMYDLARPLLRKHGFSATVFLPTKYIGGFNDWDGGTERLMSEKQIRSLAASGIDLGLHSHRHENYARYSASEIESDINDCVRSLEAVVGKFDRVFAYPFGARPTSPAGKRFLRKTLASHDIDYAVRIGSGLNAFPLRNPYELKRIGIHGTDSIRQFRRKLKKGKANPFWSMRS